MVFGKIVIYFASFSLFAHLPKPYSDLQEIRPFIDHGWYGNGRYINRLIEAHRVKTVIEVGSWLGQSTIDIARHLPEDGVIFAIDHWVGSIEHQIGNPSWHHAMPFLYEQFLSNIIHTNLTHKVIPIQMSSLDAAKIFSMKPDLIYLDASHETENVSQDIRAWYPFVKDHGILCGDDWSWPTVSLAVTQFARENGLQVEWKGNFWRYVKQDPNVYSRVVVEKEP